MRKLVCLALVTLPVVLMMKACVSTVDVPQTTTTTTTTTTTSGTGGRSGSGGDAGRG